MNPRQRNIPVTSKEEAEVQTEVKLIPSHLLDDQHWQRELGEASNIKLTDVYSEMGVLRSFSDNALLREFSRAVRELKQSQFNQAGFARRLEILEEQIDGLLRRDILLNGGQGHSGSYYSSLGDKEKTIIQLQNQKAYSDIKIQRLRTRLDSLEREVNSLRSALVQTQKISEQNKLYSGFYQRLNKVITSGKGKGQSLEELLNQQMIPLTAQFSMNLTNLTRTINRDVHTSMRGIVSSLAKEFDRLIKQQQISEEKIEDTLNALLTNFKAVRGVEDMRRQFQLSSKTQIAQNNYRNVVGLFKHEIDLLKKENPNLKSVERLDVLTSRLEGEGVQLIAFKDWIHLVTPQFKVIEVGREDKQLRELIGILGKQFRHIYSTFPQLKSHLSLELKTILESDLLIELVEGGSIERLKQIIIHQVDTIKVDNIYKYSSSKDNRLVFHLRVLVKALYEQFAALSAEAGVKMELDEGLIGLMKDQNIQGINIQQVISLFRPPARYVQVPVIVDNPVYESRTYEKGVPIHKQQAVIIDQSRIQVVNITKEVPIFIDRPIAATVVNNVPVSIESQKAVQVPVVRDVLVDRIVESCVQVPVVREKAVGLYEQRQIVKEVQTERIVDKVEIHCTEKLVETKQKEYIEVERVVQVPHYIYQTIEKIKQVEVRVPVIIKQPEYKQIERNINHIIEKKQIVNIKQEVPIQIKTNQIKIVDLVQYRDRFIYTNQYKEVVKQIPVIQEREIIREVPKEIFIERSHFIKGDQIQVIKQVQIFVDKPIIREILTTKDVEIEKAVPMYITEQVPVITEVSVPYFSEKVTELEVQKVRLIPVRQEIVKTIQIQKPVPVIVEKEVVKVEIVYRDRIIQKIVEVPRIVEIEKIVQKIVVVPRIIEKIVEVPKIIEKIVVIEQPILQIVEIPVPFVVIKEVQKIIEVPVEKIVVKVQKVIEVVEVQRIVERIIEKEKPVEVEVEKRIPYEVVREVAVPTYRDRVQYQKVQIFQTKVQTIEVQVPFIVAQKVPMIEQKAVVTEHIIQKPIIQKSVIQKEVAVIQQVEKLVVKEIYIERAIINQVVREIPFDKIVYVENPSVVQVIREKIANTHTTKQVPKEIILEQDKIVYKIIQKFVEIPINQIVLSPQVMEVPKLVNLVHYKQIAVDVPVREERIKRDIIEQTKAVEVIKQVPVEVQISRERIKQIVKQVQQFITREVPKEIIVEIGIPSGSQTTVVRVPNDTVVQEINNSSKSIEIQEKFIERIVQKIIMIPQIVEIVRNIHHVSEVNSLGVAVDVDINVQTEKYLGVSQQLRKSLLDLLSTFRANVGRQPDLKNLIAIIEKYIKYVDDWIAFPKLIEVEKEVIKEVDKERIVLVPTPDKEREASLSFLLEKLIIQLKRIRDSHKISLSLDEEIIKIFFAERRGQDSFEGKLTELKQKLKSTYSKHGSWVESDPFLINSLLKDHLSLTSLVTSINHEKQAYLSELSHLRSKMQVINNKYSNLLCFNRKMLDDNNTLIRTLQKYRNNIDDQDFESSIVVHKKFYEQIVEQKHQFIFESIRRKIEVTESRVVGLQGEQRESGDLTELISKLARYENKSQQFQSKIRRLEGKIVEYQQEIKIKQSLILKLQTQIQVNIKAREGQAQTTIIGRDNNEENKKFQEKIRLLEREIATEKANVEKVRRQLQRSTEGQKRDYDRDLQRKEREIKEASDKAKKQLQRQITKLKYDIQRFRKDKQRLEIQVSQTKKKTSEEIKQVRQSQIGSANQSYNQLLNENVKLRKESDSLQSQYEKLKKGALQNNSANERQISRLRSENERFLLQKKQQGKSKKLGLMDIPDEAQLTNKNIQLTRKVQQLEAELQKLRQKDQISVVQIKSLREKVRKLQIQLQIAKKEIQASQKSRLQATTYQSGFKPSTSIVQVVNVEGSVVRSPRSSGFRSGFEKGYMSPQESSLSRQERIEEFGSSSSRVSQSSEDQGLPSYYRSEMVLREFIDAKHGNQKQRDMYITFVMIKIIEKIEEEIQRGIFNSYTPNNIFISNFDTKNLEKLVIKFGAQITNKNNKNDGLYLSPEVLQGGRTSKKSTIFCLGVILDQLIHGSTYFKSMQEIQNSQNEFKVRGDKLNPILKNTLFEMMNKEPTKRLDLGEAKRRLSLQKYITSESRGSVTTTTRVTRRIQQE